MPLLRNALGWLNAGHGSALPDPMASATAWPEQKASATSAILAWESPRTAVWSPRDYATFANEGFMQNPIVYRSVRMIAEAAATIPLLLYAGREEIEDHPLLDLLAEPSLDQTGTDFLEAWYGYLLVSGNAYAEAVAVDGRLREIHALRPDRMKVVPGPDGWPEAFEYSAGGRSVRLAGESVGGVRRVLHTRLFHPTNDHYGMSPIEAASVAIDTHNTAAKWNKALLDNSARPSGALVYANRDGHLTEEQFARLKAELEAGFQGARHAGRPLLLEGGLDWKPLSLTPKDMDFVEAKNSAAREIALALGVPPMLLGIPGDNTYANYQEASRSLWRQTVLPLVNRTAKALSGWLAPGFGPDRLVLKPDLDQIEALSSEREALWARLEKASFLTDDEKRASIGFGPKSAGSIARGSGRGGEPPIDRAAKFNPYHDELGRFTTADGAASGSGGQEAGDEDVESADDGSADDDAGLQQVNSRRNQLVTVGGRTYQATPEQATVLSTSATRADAALRRVRELDPEWRPAPSLSGQNSAEGAIATYRALAQQAEARLTVIERGGLPLGFNSREEYATFGRSARTALNEAGFPEAVPYLRGSAVTGYSYRTGEAFDVGRRSDYDIAIVSPRLFEHLIARGIETSGRGSRTLAVGPAELPAGPLRNWLEQVIRNRPSSIVVHRGLGELERRGPYAAMD